MKAQGSRLRWTISTGLGALLGILVLPGAASGATATVAGGALTFTAANAEANDLLVETAGSVFRVIDTNAPVTAGTGCNQRSLHRVHCPSAGVNLVRVVAGDADDTVLTVIGATDAELSGGRGADELTGSDGDDTLSAGRGGVGFDGESLSAGGGNDTLNGSPSVSTSVTMNGGAGDDQLLGGAGIDNLFGDLGADVIKGGDGFSDSASWDFGTPISVTVGSGANDGAAGEGDDVRGDVEGIFGTDLNDVLIGNVADNTLIGSSGQDTVQGGDGNDVLDGGDGPDTLAGGQGQDSMRGGDQGDDFSGGEGIDQVRFDDHFGGPVTVTINNVANDGGGSGGGGAEGDNVRTDVEAVAGTNFNDTLIGSSQDNHLFGLDGDDDLSGEGGDDELFGDFEFQSGTAGADDLGGGNGDDSLFGGGEGDVYRGGSGFDFVNYSQFAGSNDLTITINNVADDGVAGEGDNVMDSVDGIVGANGNDTITGSAAANVLFGGGGADNIAGANGNDLLDGETPGLFTPAFLGDVLNGGGGNDTVSYRSHNFNGVTVDIGGGANDGASGGTEGDDVQSTVENLIGSDGIDILTGNGAANTISGGNSGDTLNGGEGGDSLAGNGGFDTHEGQGGNDEINSRGDPGFIDTDNCGAGGDTAVVDSDDTVNPDCEEVIE